MKWMPALGLAFLIAPQAATAQVSYGVAGMEDSAPKPQVYVPAVPQAQSCPVALQARHLPDGGLTMTRNGHPKGIGQALHLTFTSPDARALASATILVHGWVAPHFQPAAGDHARAVRTLQVPLKAGNDHTAQARLWVPGLTAVESIDLLSASFRDGSTWNPSAGTTCRVTPDLLMLISAH